MNNLEIDKILTQNFGYKGLRPIQKNVINATYSNQDIIVLCPTGGGKSLCYQLPALLHQGLTIIISPLRSLIYDQVTSLKKKNIPVELLSGDVSSKDKNTIFKKLQQESLPFSLLYTTPETLLANYELINILETLNEKEMLSRIVIDEAHCVSSWGHDFRPAYLKLGGIKCMFENVPLMVLTATATDKVLSDIKHLLQINEHKLFKQSFYRKNLNINIIQKSNEKETVEEIKNLLRTKYKNQSGIIYCYSRKSCESLSSKLQLYSINSAFYHAGLNKNERENVQTDWLNNDIQVIVATIAFGMGIDKPDVRFVFHMNMPMTIENYYQEIGRSGRDGLKSDCIIFYQKSKEGKCSKDLVLYTKMINSDKTNSPKRKDYNKKRINKIYQTVKFIENTIDCRHKLLSNYFGENDIEKCNNGCDNCIKNTGKMVTKDITELAKHIINCILLLKQYASRIKIKQILTGHHYMKKYKSKLFYNILDNEEEIERIISKLVTDKYIKEIPIQTNYGNWSDKLQLYKKSQNFLESITTKIYLPIIKENKLDKYFLPKKLNIISN